MFFLPPNTLKRRRIYGSDTEEIRLKYGGGRKEHWALMPDSNKIPDVSLLVTDPREILRIA
jgi:hypothetical protein